MGVFTGLQWKTVVTELIWYQMSKVVVPTRTGDGLSPPLPPGQSRCIDEVGFSPNASATAGANVVDGLSCRGDSADAGANLKNTVSDNLTIDAQVLNGEGYKNLQSDNQFRGGAGITYNTDDISFRVSRDMIPRSMYGDDYDAQYINTFAAIYSGSNITLGGEYNLRENTSFVVDNTSTAFSVYGSLDIGNDVSIFGRYDLSDSEDANENQWNIDNEGELTIVGIEKQMTKGVKVALNVKSFKAATLDGEEELTEYQKDWLRNYIEVWDRTEQNSIHVEIPSYQHEDIVRQLDDAIDVCGRATSYDDHPDHTKTYPFASGYAKSAMRDIKERLQRYG